MAILVAYSAYPWLCRRSATEAEASAPLAGDEVVPRSTSAYTLATAIAAPPSTVWPWLVQMGQGRAGFYTHEWVENLMGAHIYNANRIVPELQHLPIPLASSPQIRWRSSSETFPPLSERARLPRSA